MPKSHIKEVEHMTGAELKWHESAKPSVQSPVPQRIKKKKRRKKRSAQKQDQHTRLGGEASRLGDPLFWFLERT
jgi:hypothetical protein